MATSFQDHWKMLYTQKLPHLARMKAPSQPNWPVQLDHCFARIILDTVIGRPEPSSWNSTPVKQTSVPWTAKLKSPAIKNMTENELERCCKLADDIAAGRVDLVELDRQSLLARGKAPKKDPAGALKRKRDDSMSTAVTAPAQDQTEPPTPASPPSKKTPKPSQPSILKYTANHPLAAPTTQQASTPSPEITKKINLHPTLTPFRKRLYLALCQVPPGEYTTYAALSKYLNSSPRAVGNALRNNPFAPYVPCHRVMASGGGIGGFGGDWGKEGRHAKKKVDLLRKEGVKVLGDGSGVKGRVWEGFIRKM